MARSCACDNGQRQGPAFSNVFVIDDHCNCLPIPLTSLCRVSQVELVIVAYEKGDYAEVHAITADLSKRISPSLASEILGAASQIAKPGNYHVVRSLEPDSR